MRYSLLLAVLLVCAPCAADDHAEVRGMTISCPGWGAVWGSDRMVDSMELLADLGVNWIAIHPYAQIRADGTVSMGQHVYNDPTFITRPIEEAQRLGLKIMIKPHIAYWGSKFSWRGEIEFKTSDEWDRFFATYETWITRVAEISKDADAFVVGTELDLTTVSYEDEWRAIIAKVREKTDAPLTYAANWDQYRKTPFWDALDAVSVQAYFPLVAHEGMPSHDELDAGWARVIQQLELFGKKHGKPVVLGELGYNRSTLAAARPWEYQQLGEEGEEVQRRCLTAALEALAESDTVRGAFLWKWFPGESSRGNFIKSTPAMREVITAHWGKHDDATERGASDD